MSGLVLSGQAELFWSGHASVDHRVMIRAKHPHVVALRVLSALWLSESMQFVVNIYNAVLSANGALGFHVWAPTKETFRASRVAVDLGDLFSIRRISPMEAIARTSLSLFGAWRRTVEFSPVVKCFAPELRSADTTSACALRGRAMAAKVGLPIMPRSRASWFAESLINLVRNEGYVAHLTRFLSVDCVPSSYGVAHGT